MKHYRLFSLLVCMAVCTAIFAGPRTYSQALDIARRQAALCGTAVENLADSTPAVQRRKSLGAQLSRHAFLFTHAGQKGFTVVAADDRLPAVIAYSASGTFDATRLSPGFSYYMQAYQALAEAVQRGDALALRQAAEMQAVRQNRKAGQVAVSPLLRTQWNQGEPYNGLCPLIDGQPTYTGCVATALAQVMAYHRWPQSLASAIPGYTTSSAGLVMPAIPAGTPYAWDSMLQRYDPQSDYTSAQAQAVATLMYHVGAAVNMDYGTAASGARYSTRALVKYFNYDADLMQQVYRSSFTLEQWQALIDAELLAARPLCVSGNNGVSGHAFVCDGADGAGLYHINWGWGGYQDGYFDIGVLNPDKGGIGSGSGTDGFANALSMIVGFTPDNGVEDAPLVTFSCSDICMLWNTSMPVTFSRSVRTGVSQPFIFTVQASVCNPTDRDCEHFDWNIGIRLADGTYQPLGEGHEDASLPAQTDNGVYNYYNIDFPCSYALPVGRYLLYSIVREQGGQWRPCSNTYGVKQPVLEVTEHTVTDVTDQLALKADIAPAEPELVPAAANRFTLTLNNAAGNAFTGKLYVYRADRPDLNSRQLVHSRYAVVQTDEEQTLDLALDWGTAPRQYVWVETDGDVLVNAKPVDLSASAAMLSLVNITSNASADQTYNNVFLAGRQLALPYIDGTQAEVVYHLRNDGPDTDVTPCFTVYDAFSNQELTSVTRDVIRLPGQGAVTPLGVSVSHTLSASGVMYCTLTTDPQYTSVYLQPIPFLDNRNETATLGETTYLFYVSGNTSGIDRAQAVGAPVLVSGRRGTLCITAASTRRVGVYGTGGQLVARPLCPAGQTVTVPLPPGLYVVAGKKVAVY